MGFLSLPYYIMLGWTYWLLGSSLFFFIGFCWTTFVGPYLTLSLLGFSRPILLFEKGHSTPMHYPSLKEGPWAHFGLYFLFSTSILSFFCHCLGHICVLSYFLSSWSMAQLPFLCPDLGFSPHWAFGHGLAKTGVNNSFDVDHVKIPYCLIFNFLKNLFLKTIFL